MGVDLKLWFERSGWSKLAKIHFCPEVGAKEIVTEEKLNDFKWQLGQKKFSALAAICLWAVGFRRWMLVGRKPDEFRFLGPIGSPASRLYTSLENDIYTKWFKRVFGDTGDSHTNVHKFIHPSQKNNYFGVRLINIGSPHIISIYLDGALERDQGVLAELEKEIEVFGGWPKRNIDVALPPEISNLVSLAFYPQEENKRSCDLEYQLIQHLYFKYKLSRHKEIKVPGVESCFDKRTQHEHDLRAFGNVLSANYVLTVGIHHERNVLRLRSSLYFEGGVTPEYDFQRERDVKPGKLSEMLGKLADMLFAELNSHLGLTYPVARGNFIPMSAQDESFKLYARGRVLLRVRGKGLPKAQKCFESASQKDPDYTLARCALAETLIERGFYGQLAPTEAFPPAKRQVNWVLKNSPEDPDALFCRALIDFYYDFRWKAAERTFKQVIKMVPTYAMAHYKYGWLLTLMKRFDEGIREMKAASEIERSVEIFQAGLVVPTTLKGEFLQARELNKRVLTNNPQNIFGHLNRGLIELCETNPAVALKHFERAWRLQNRALTTGWFGYCSGLSKKQPKAESLLTALGKLKVKCPYSQAMICVGLGRMDEARGHLKNAFAIRSPRLIWLNVDPAFEKIIEHNEIRSLRKRVGWLFDEE